MKKEMTQFFELSDKNELFYQENYIGKEVDVLFEQSISENTYEGLTPNYIRVVVKSNKDIHGEILEVKLTDTKDEYVEAIRILRENNIKVLADIVLGLIK